MNMLKKFLNRIQREGFTSTLRNIFRYKLNFKRKRAYQDMLNKSSINERFNEIYEKNLWSSKESGSGEGSELNYTKPLRNWLLQTLPRYNIHTFVDAPCGDFNWMQEVLPKLDVKYIGLDIVSSVVDTNKAKFSTENISFNTSNICEDVIPDCDLIMVRDCLFHLSFDEINKFLQNLSNSNYKYLLTTTHIVEKNFINTDITSGDFRLIDLFSAPFLFDNENVIGRVHDYPAGHPTPREMILIEKSFVPISLLD